MTRTAAAARTAATPVTAKAKAFEAALDMINKKLKSDTGTLIAKLSDRPLNVETISTGSVVLDSIAGGGFPKGRIIEVFGAESSGKTSMALIAAANVQKEGGTVAFIDLENALDPRYASKLGVNIEELAVAQPDYAEQALELVEQLAASGVVDLIILDSVAALVPKIELEGELEQQNMAVVARILSRSLKKLVNTANKTHTTVIFINQVREKVGFVLGDPTITPGGKALKFFASQRIRVTRAKQVTDEKTKKAIGNEVKIKVIKNKIAPPFGEGLTVLTFNKGINRAAEMIEVGPKYGLVDRPNNRTYTEASTGEILGTSKGDAVATLEADPARLERLSVALKAAIEADLFSDASTTVGPEEGLEDEALTEADLENE
jgi:recombination protein RecA